MAENCETKCNNIQSFLLNPTNAYVEYLGIDPDVIHDYVILRGKEAEDWPRAIG